MVVFYYQLPIGSFFYRRFIMFWKKASNFFSFQNSVQAKWTPRQYSALVKEGYEKNVIVYRCISLIARGVASVTWKSESNLGVSLLSSPNANESWSCFMESLVTSFLCSGNAFVLIEVNKEGDPVSFKNLRSDRMHIKTEDEEIVSYEYTINGKSRSYGVNEQLLKIVHLKSIHPLNDWLGLSPIEVAAMAIDQHNAVSTHNVSILQNGGRPSGVFIWKGEGYPLTAEQKANLRESIGSLYSGQQNAGKIAVLDGSLEWKEMGLSPKDLDFVEGKHVAAREIAQVFGVPTMLIGVPGEATYENYKEARFHLWEDTILPLLDRIQTAFGKQLNMSFSYDMNKIPALAPRREALWSKISNASFLSQEEQREALGYMC